jgi:hypothetical protein
MADRYLSSLKTDTKCQFGTRPCIAVEKASCRRWESNLGANRTCHGFSRINADKTTQTQDS